MSNVTPACNCACGPNIALIRSCRQTHGPDVRVGIKVDRLGQLYQGQIIFLVSKVIVLMRYIIWMVLYVLYIESDALAFICLIKVVLPNNNL